MSYSLANSVYSGQASQTGGQGDRIGNYLENYLNQSYFESHLSIATFPSYRDAETALFHLQNEGFTVRKIAVVGTDCMINESNELNEPIHSFIIWKDIFKPREPKDWLNSSNVCDSDFNISKKLMNALLQLGISELRAIKYMVEIETGKSAVFISGIEKDIKCLQQNFPYSKIGTDIKRSEAIAMSV